VGFKFPCLLAGMASNFSHSLKWLHGWKWLFGIYQYQ
jgi:hypothetical protein